MDDKKEGLFIKAINIIFESMGFIILSYLLLSSMSSFRKKPVYILFFTTNIVLISRFWRILKDIGMNNVVVAIIFIICIAILVVLCLRFGYLLMTPIKLTID
ncbi:MAG: hypothetical protein GXY88_01970 [Tissierellia bacterium]|nr:hypothetical protein [Tissierellia bacterium]